jgi:hypothetical protein
MQADALCIQAVLTNDFNRSGGLFLIHLGISIYYLFALNFKYHFYFFRFKQPGDSFSKLIEKVNKHGF